MDDDGELRSFTPLRRCVFAAAAAAALVLALMGSTGAGTAHAEPPTPLSGQIVDRAGVLGTDQARVQAALDALQAAHGTLLSVVYVRSFDDPADGHDWVHEVKRLSNLAPQGDAAAVLLAVAVDDHRYGVAVTRTGEIPVQWSTFDDLVERDVDSHVNDARWADAAITFADGLRTGKSAADDQILRNWVIALLGVAAAAVLGRWLLSRRH